MKRAKHPPEVLDRVVALRDGTTPPMPWRQVEEALAQEGIRLSHEGARVAYLDAKTRVLEAEGDRGGDGGESEGGAGHVGEEVPLPDIPENASVAARVLFAQLADTRERMRRLPKGQDAATEYASLARVALQQLSRLEQMLPPPAPDARKDPRNIGAREAVHVRVLQVIEAAEARAGALCPRCFREVTKR